MHPVHGVRKELPERRSITGFRMEERAVFCKAGMILSGREYENDRNEMDEGAA